MYANVFCRVVYILNCAYRVVRTSCLLTHGVIDTSIQHATRAIDFANYSTYGMPNLFNQNESPSPPSSSPNYPSPSPIPSLTQKAVYCPNGMRQCHKSSTTVFYRHISEKILTLSTQKIVLHEKRNRLFRLLLRSLKTSLSPFDNSPFSET